MLLYNNKALNSNLKYFIFISNYYNGFHVFKKKNIHFKNSCIIFFSLKSLAIYKVYFTKQEYFDTEKLKNILRINIENPNFSFIKNIMIKYYNDYLFDSKRFIIKGIRERDFSNILRLLQAQDKKNKILTLINYNEEKILLFSYGKNEIPFMVENSFIFNTNFIHLFYKYLHGIVMYHESEYYNELINAIQEHKKYLLQIINTISYSKIAIWASNSFHNILFLYFITNIYQNDILRKEQSKKVRKNIFVLQKNNEKITNSANYYKIFHEKVNSLKNRILIIYNWENSSELELPNCLDDLKLHNLHFTFLKGNFTKDRLLHNLTHQDIRENFNIIFYYGHSIIKNGNIYWKLQDTNFLLPAKYFHYYVHLSCFNFSTSTDKLNYLPCDQGIFPISYIEKFSPHLFIDEFIKHLHKEKNFMDATFSFFQKSTKEIYDKLFLSFFQLWTCP